MRTAQAAARQKDVSVLDGMLAGIAGGAAMAIVAVLISWAAGTGLWSSSMTSPRSPSAQGLPRAVVRRSR